MIIILESWYLWKDFRNHAWCLIDEAGRATAMIGASLSEAHRLFISAPPFRSLYCFISACRLREETNLICVKVEVNMADAISLLSVWDKAESR